jgi:chromosome segregation ATPase
MSETEMFEASLELRLEQEEKQLEIYRSYLEQQQEALQDSLDKRKEAYESYFDAINEQQSDEDYQEKVDQLTANLTKLSASTDMASKKQAKELEQQLEDLEKERQQELRERAQEAVIEAIDTEVEEINAKFDKLLDNEQLLLEAMKENMKDPSFANQILASNRESGMTDLQLEQLAKDFSDAFSSVIDTTNLDESLEQIINNATINVGDQTVNLDTEDGNAMWETILATLIKYGYGR